MSWCLSQSSFRALACIYPCLHILNPNSFHPFTSRLSDFYLYASTLFCISCSVQHFQSSKGLKEQDVVRISVFIYRFMQPSTQLWVNILHFLIVAISPYAIDAPSHSHQDLLLAYISEFLVFPVRSILLVNFQSSHDCILARSSICCISSLVLDHNQDPVQDTSCCHNSEAA